VLVVEPADGWLAAASRHEERFPSEAGHGNFSPAGHLVPGGNHGQHLVLGERDGFQVRAWAGDYTEIDRSVIDPVAYLLVGAFEHGHRDTGEAVPELGDERPVCDADGVITVFDVSVLEMRTVYCGSGRADRTVQIEAKTLIDLVRPVIAAVTGQPATCA
jgi:hypothetical protein